MGKTTRGGWFGRRFKIWFRALVAAAIVGSSQAVLNSAVVSFISPGTFNLGEGLWLLTQAIIGFVVVGGVVGVFAYLAKSPLPDAPRDPHKVEELQP